MATRKKRSNATLSKKELTRLEKEAEARSARRRANVARNKAAGNAGLSSQRLNRMEAEAERASTQRRQARRASTNSQMPERVRDMIRDNTDAQMRTERRGASGSSTRGAQRPAPRGLTDTIRQSTDSVDSRISRALSRIGTLAKGLTGAGAFLTAEEAGRGSDVIPPGQRDAFVRSRDRGRGDGAAEVKARREQNKKSTNANKKSDEKKKNYNVGVSKGGVPFKEAFAHFRKKGQKTFTWNGKKYTTKLKEEEK